MRCLLMMGGVYRSSVSGDGYDVNYRCRCRVMYNMNTRESAVIIAMTFQKAVERGEVENTDEAYISFANQYIA